MCIINISHLNLLLWNNGVKYKKKKTLPGWSFQNCFRQPCLPFKMAAVTKKNRNFCYCLLMLYYNWIQFVNCRYRAMLLNICSRFFLRNFSFSQLMWIMQIRHIFIRKNIFKSSPLNCLNQIRPHLSGIEKIKKDMIWLVNIALGFCEATSEIGSWIFISTKVIEYS